MLNPELPIKPEAGRLAIYIFAFVLVLIVVYFIWSRLRRNKKRWLDNLSARKKIINPEHFGRGKEVSKSYPKLKKTYSEYELSNYIKRRKIKYWRLVYIAEDSHNDRFIPIFYKKRRRRK